jgi:hypothetical protein
LGTVNFYVKPRKLLNGHNLTLSLLKINNKRKKTLYEGILNMDYTVVILITFINCGLFQYGNQEKIELIHADSYLSRGLPTAEAIPVFCSLHN